MTKQTILESVARYRAWEDDNVEDGVVVTGRTPPDDCVSPWQAIRLLRDNGVPEPGPWHFHRLVGILDAV